MDVADDTPLPARLRPVSPVAIAARAHELEELAVGDEVLRGGERCNLGGTGAVLVIPSERAPVARLAHLDFAPLDFNHFILDLAL